MAQHISIRVPWHDNDYCGRVCKDPCHNTSCLRLKNISANKDDNYEDNIADCPFSGHEDKLPCISEGGAFMSPIEIRRTVEHPYKASNPKTHGHFLPTEEVFPPYSLPARPFKWLMKKLKNDHDYAKGNIYNINYRPELEPDLAFDTFWVQDAENQRGIFRYFYHDVVPKKSLCLIYAKQVPFVEDSRRVIIGIGYVDKVTPAVEYEHTDAGDIRCLTWETMISHTIRKDCKNGFLFPYKEMMKYAEEHPDFDIRSVTVFASDEYFEEFSYATEHLSHDAVIDVLLQSLKAMTIVKECIDGDWDDCIRWLNQRFTEVWEDRGAFPGIGAMLCAAGFSFGILIAEELKNIAKKDTDIWQLLDVAIANPIQYLSKDIANSITPINQKTWKDMSAERKTLFRLLSRLSLDYKQAMVCFQPEYRRKAHIDCTDTDIINNPYVLYEKSRSSIPEYRLSVKNIDMAIFPPKEILDRYPVPAPSALTSDNDERRIRAYIIYLLEQQSLCGHTVYPVNNMILELNDLSIKPECNVNSDIINAIKEYLSHEIEFLQMKNGEPAIQLARLKEIDDVIRSAVNNRVGTKKRHTVQADWKSIINNAFGNVKEDDTDELRAREEKAAILKELSEARLSVLIGGAGTGKTTLLSLLCTAEQIKNGGILLLAPTGKARVKMSQAMQAQGVTANAKTVAQFLIKNKRFDFNCMQYRLSNVPADNVPDTVIIDECSMLTEEMFGALLQALKKAQRIILVGDPNQLPPIGAGRPFVDLVNHLKKDLSPTVFPKVKKSFGELTVTRRQQADVVGEQRFDTELAKWYIDGENNLDDDIFAKLQGSNPTDSVVFRQWKDNEELEKCILETMASELGMNGIDDQDGFDKSLGGTVTDRGTYYNIGSAKYADKWQILAPVRNMVHGVININHLIHEQYREHYLDLAKRTIHRKIPNPMGPENIVYGDKVINVINGGRDAYPEENAENYIANGEIGIAGISFGKQVKFLNVEFSSQPGFTYSFTSNDFGDDVDARLELAYALTIHKAQGSEFDTVILVLNNQCHLISKELLYTAITRQKKKLIILYNDEAYSLRSFASSAHSDIAQRFTNLFDEPDIVKVNDKYYENYLIHRTMRGEMVRSKSEVIIANALYSSGIDYEYEKELIIDGVRKLPDFTIDNPETGDFIIWEHCGMMTDLNYRKKWEEKKRFYESNGYIEGENLIVTYDEDNGSINSPIIKEYIKKFL